ncbi:methionine synthase reductase-like, partial [Paramuricea clavata]
MNEDDTLPNSSTDTTNDERPFQTTPTDGDRLPSSVDIANEGTSKPLIDKEVLQNDSAQQIHSVDKPSISEETKAVAQELKDKTPSLRISRAPLSESDLSIPILPASYLSITFTDVVRRDTSSCPWQGGVEFPGSASPITQSKIVSACLMTKDNAVKTAYCLTLDTGDIVLDYSPGDSFGIICPNNENEVEDLITRLDYQDQANHVFTLEAKETVGNKKR